MNRKGMDDFISRDDFIKKKRKLYCENCSRRKDSKGNTVYEIGDAPCRSCGIGDVLDDLDDFPAADAIEELVRKEKFHAFLWNTIQPNEMEQYLAMYRAQDVPSEPPKEE